MAPQKRSKRGAEEPIQEGGVVANVAQEPASEAVQRELSRLIDRVAHLEEELSRKELKIIEKDDEIHQAWVTFKTAFALKSRKVTDLEKKLAAQTRRNEELVEELAAEKAKSVTIAKQSMIVHDTKATVIRTIFPKVSEITDVVYSKTVSSAIANWTFFIKRSDSYLSYYVNPYRLHLSNRTFWHAIVAFRLLSHEDGSVLFEICLQQLRYEPGHGWGRKNAIPFEKLIDPNEKFVKEDSIIVEVEIRECDSPPEAPIAAPEAVQPLVA